VFGLGTREYVALAILALAVLMGFLFFNPASTENPTELHPTISLGLTVTPTPPPTATPTPVHAVAKPTAQWYVIYYERGVNGGDIKSGEGFVDGLDFDIADRPFLDFKPDAWSMQVANKVDVEAGSNRFQLEVDGEAKVWIDGTLTAQAPNGDSAVKLPVEFEHNAGRANIMIEVRDTGGPVKLRWLD
jgi:hypothetical protein